MSIPLISVIIPIFNGEKYIAESIESILKQTFPHWECIIINDGSTDDSDKICKEYLSQDDRIRYIELPHHLGISKSRNKWIQSAKGRYIVWQDADDISASSRLQTLYEHMEENPEIVISGSFVTLLQEKNIRGVRKFPWTDTCIRSALYRYNPISQASAIVRRDALVQIGGFDESLSCAEDLDILFRLGVLGKFSNIQTPLLSYRLHKNSTTVRSLKDMGHITFWLRKKYHSIYWPNLLNRCVSRCEQIGFLCIPYAWRIPIFRFFRDTWL